MELSKEVKQRYLEFCHCETNGHVYVTDDNRVCVQKNLFQYAVHLVETQAGDLKDHPAVFLS